MATLANALSVGNELTPYWQEIADLRVSLQAGSLTGRSGRFVFITSLPDPYRGRIGGATCEAYIETAAKALAKNAHGGASHRLATEDEIESFKAAQAERKITAEREAEAGKPVQIFRMESTPNKDGSMALKPILEQTKGAK